MDSERQEEKQTPSFMGEKLWVHCCYLATVTLNKMNDVLLTSSDIQSMQTLLLSLECLFYNWLLRIQKVREKRKKERKRKVERLLLIKIILDAPLTSTFLFKILSRKKSWWKRLTVSSLRRKSCKNYHRACDSFPNVHSGHYLTLRRALWNSLGTERGERL